jgi:hypothetical protein
MVAKKEAQLINWIVTLIVACTSLDYVHALRGERSRCLPVRVGWGKNGASLRAALRRGTRYLPPMSPTPTSRTVPALLDEQAARFGAREALVGGTTLATLGSGLDGCRATS